MYCKYCGNQIDDDSAFCNFCGKNLSSSVQGALNGNTVDDIIKNAIWEGVEHNHMTNPSLIRTHFENTPRNKDIKTITVNGVSFDMVYVEGGSFVMGDIWGNGQREELPRHTVSLSGYYIGKFAVTQGLWKAVTGKVKDFWTTFKYGTYNNYPVDSVSWNDCQDFIMKLNSLTGLTFRLPTEAEWEYAARGGKQNVRGSIYSGSDKIAEVAWYKENSNLSTHPVGQKKSNVLGLYDMCGNVWERCNDWYDNYNARDQINPIGPSPTTTRVVRGGAYSCEANFCRVSRRFSFSPDFRAPGIGFRLVLVP